MLKFLKFAPLLLLALPGLTAAHGPSRQKVEKEIDVGAPPAKVWAVIQDFCAIEKWHPAIAKCEGEGGNAVGAKRTLTLKGDNPEAKIFEELSKYDGEKMSYKYKITKVDVKVLPVTTYAAEITVADNGKGGSTVKWKGGFYRGDTTNNPPPELSDEAAVKAITGIYDDGLASIKKLAEGG
jgi:uncharacterized protein YndB with AHSA1/START domain